MNTASTVVDFLGNKEGALPKKFDTVFEGLNSGAKTLKSDLDDCCKLTGENSLVCEAEGLGAGNWGARKTNSVAKGFKEVEGL